MKKITSAFLVYLLLAHSAFALSLSGDDWKNPLRTKTWTPPSVSDTLAGLTATQSFQNKTFDRSLNSITNLNITNTDISSSASIAYSKLASLLTGQILCGNAGSPAACTMSGGASIGATGVVTLNNSSIITQLLTGYVAGAGTVTPTDSILQAIQKIDGNDQLKIAKSVVVAKGDLIGASSSSAPARIAVGSSGDVLSADSSNANGVAYRTVKENLSALDQFQGFEGTTGWSTGNNATVMGGGTLNGTFASDTAFPYKYTQGASSLNDYWCSPVKTIKEEFKGPTVFVSTALRYNGSSADIQVSIYDATNSTPLSSFSPVSLPSAPTSVSQLMSGVFPSATNSYRICYQVKALNNGKILNLGPVVSSKSLTDFGSIAPYSGYDWQPCMFPSLTWQGLGTVTNNLECKRDTNSLKIRGQFGAGITSPNIAEIPFPTNWNTITASSTVVDGTSYGSFFRGVALANSFFSARAVTAGTNVIRVAGPLVSTTANPTVAINGNSFLANSEVAMIDGELTIPIAQWSGSGASIASPVQQISSDTMNFTFKSSAINCSSDPVGTYNTYNKNNSATSATILNSSGPTQTSASMNTNGVILKFDNYGGGSNNLSPNKFEFCIGQNLKSLNIQAYGGAGKTIPLQINLGIPSSTAMYGLVHSYDSTTGKLSIDGTALYGTGVTTRAMYDNNSYTSYTSPYIVFNASTTPDITAIPITGNNHTPFLSPGLRVETFTVRYTGAGGGSTVCSSGNCVLSQVGNPVSTIAFVSAGVYTMTPTRKYLHLFCSLSPMGASSYLGPQMNEYNAGAGTIGFQTGTGATATNSFGTLFCQGFY